MKMLISQERLWQKIESDPDLDVEAGLPIVASREADEPAELAKILEDGAGVEQPRAYLGAILREVRRRDGLTIEALAGQARVDVSQIRGLEQDPAFQPRPRTVHRLAELLSLPQAEVARLAGSIVVNDDNPASADGYKFAAKSDDLSTLNAVDRAQLSAFVDTVMARLKANA